MLNAVCRVRRKGEYLRQEGLWKLCSITLIAISGLKCVGLLAIFDLYLIQLLMVSLIQEMLLTCGVITSRAL